MAQHQCRGKERGVRQKKNLKFNFRARTGATQSKPRDARFPRTRIGGLNEPWIKPLIAKLPSRRSSRLLVHTEIVQMIRPLFLSSKRLRKIGATRGLSPGMPLEAQIIANKNLGELNLPTITSLNRLHEWDFRSSCRFSQRLMEFLLDIGILCNCI